MQGPDAIFDTSRRQRPRWILPLLAIIIIAGISVGVFYLLKRQRESMARQQLERLEELGRVLRADMENNQGVFPAELKLPANQRQLLDDIASGTKVVYRGMTSTGEPLRYDFFGERIIAWSPLPTYLGKHHAVLLNNLEAKLVPPGLVDFESQKLKIVDPLNRTQPRLMMPSQAPDGGDEGGEEGDSVEEEQPASEPATEPSTRP